MRGPVIPEFLEGIWPQTPDLTYEVRNKSLLTFRDIWVAC